MLHVPLSANIVLMCLQLTDVLAEGGMVLLADGELTKMKAVRIK